MHPRRRARTARHGRPPAGDGRQALRVIEKRADSVARKIFIGANRTFQAPIDREDILLLAHDLDDVVDLIEDTAKGIQRYSISVFAEEMRSMVDAVVESADLLQQVMPFLDSITRDHKTIFALCEKVGNVEQSADESFDAFAPSSGPER